MWRLTLRGRSEEPEELLEIIFLVEDGTPVG
jgi:hypothetical protein